MCVFAAFNAPYQLEYSSVFSPEGYKPTDAQELLLRPKQGDVGEQVAVPCRLPLAISPRTLCSCQMVLYYVLILAAVSLTRRILLRFVLLSSSLLRVSRLLPLSLCHAVIAATDGLFDNLFTRDVQAQLAKFDFAPCRALAHARRRRQAESARTAWELDRAAAGDNKRPLERLALLGVAEQLPVTDAELEASEKACRATLQSMATMLAIAAQRVGGDPNAASPFAAAARKQAGWDYRGGKMDDVCVVAAVVVADDTRLPKIE